MNECTLFVIIVCGERETSVKVKLKVAEVERGREGSGRSKDCESTRTTHHLSALSPFIKKPSHAHKHALFTKTSKKRYVMDNTQSHSV